MKSFICCYDQCNQKYTTKYNLTRHIQVFHLNQKFECNHCGQLLSSSQSLKDHRFCHTGEKPYKCKYPGCTKHYRQASQLSVHKKKHLTMSLNLAKCFKELKIILALNENDSQLFQIPSGPFTVKDINLSPILMEN